MSNEIKPVLPDAYGYAGRSHYVSGHLKCVDAIYIVCGRTDMRKSIDGLCAIIQEQFSMEIDHALFSFCGRKCDHQSYFKRSPDGIVMIYKKTDRPGILLRWPRVNLSPESYMAGVRLADVWH